MKRIHKRTLVGLLVAAALLVAAGSALAASQNGRGPLFGGMPSAMHNGGGGGHGVMAGDVVMDAAADYIGISETELMTARHSGKSLAQIAVEHGKTAAGLEAALVTAFDTYLHKAVAAGRITEAQAARALSTFKAQVATMVERTTTGPANGRSGGMMAGFGSGHCRQP